ncbi:MAG: hypothetical protein ACRDSL_06790 [Pseudonocardiaceae bacterium]
MHLNDLLTLIISSLALLVSGLALGWNIVNYLLTGQRAKLHVMAAKLVDPTNGKTHEPVVTMTVSATGRVPIEVTGWSLSFPDDSHLHSELVRLQYGHLEGVHLGDDLPKLIQPGCSGTFMLPRVAIDAAAKHYNFDLNKGHIQIFFAARKTLRDKSSIAKRISLKPDADSE